jgi:class 3 adenylate cyclase
MSPTPVKLNPIEAFKLHSMGLVRFVQGQVVPSGDLCRRYFSDRLSQWQLNLLQEHRLATIVSINVVNFTGMMATDSEKTQNLLYQNFQFITQLGKQYEGQFLKSTEDGLLIYFPSTIDAVNCAQEIQLAFRQIAEATSEPILTYRIGIHLGDVIFNCKDVTGPGINIATHLQTEIPAGDICISQTVYEAVRSHLPLQPIEIGQEQFEGIEEPMSVYQLTL